MTGVDARDGMSGKGSDTRGKATIPDPNTAGGLRAPFCTKLIRTPKKVSPLYVSYVMCVCT